MKRKAQITIIIIIGIVLLFIFAGVLYIINKTTEDNYGQQKEVIISKVSQEFNPVKKFTDDCLQAVAEKGLTLLGQQGGYIYPDLAGEFKKDAPTESAGIAFEPAKIPYWWYVSSKNPDPKITYSSLQPSLKKPIQRAEDEMTVEKQLARYIKEKLNDECLKDYALFKDEGFIVKTGKMETAVSVNPTDVGIYLDYPLEISKGEAKSNPEKFYVSVPLELKKMYELASLITEMEKNYTYLERHIAAVYTLFSAVDYNKLPPVMTKEFKLETVTWSKTDLKETMKGVLSSYTPVLRIQGSENFYRYEYGDLIKYPEVLQRVYDNAGLGIPGAEGLEIRFDYLNWEPYYEITGHGETIGPVFSSSNIPDFAKAGAAFTLVTGGLMIPLQDYHNTYDLSWPVMITITDSKAFGGKGYSFSFALEGNIRNNWPAKPEQIVPPAIASFSKSMACDKEKMKAGPLVFNVVDGETKKPLEKVQLAFSLPPTDTCILGLTDSEGTLESKAPAAYGGVVNFIKADYLNNYYPIDTYKLKDKQTLVGYSAAGTNALNDNAVAPIEMYRIKTLNASIKKINLNKCVSGSCYPSGIPFKGEPVYSFNPEMLDNGKHSYYLAAGGQPLKETEQAIITLRKVRDLKKGIINQDFAAAVTVIGPTMTEIRLVPGIYEVTGNLVLNEPVIIPKEERCSPDVFLWWGSECFSLKEVELNKFSEGILRWNEEKNYITITPEDLYSSNLITFYLPSQNIQAVPEKAHLRVIEDLRLMGEIENVSRLPNVRAALEPRWS